MRVVKRQLAAAALVLVLSSASAANVQTRKDIPVEGYYIPALLAYWNVGRDIQSDYRFDHGHANAVDAVEDGQLVLSVDREDEEGARSRSWLMAHCAGDAPDGGRLRHCRYRLITSSLVAADEEIEFDAAGAAERLRGAGVTPAAFGALVSVVPLSAGRPQTLPEQWAEVRRMQQIIIAPLIAQFDARLQTSTIDSATCPAMLLSLQQLDRITLPPSRVPGLSNQPRFRASVPHSPTYSFVMLSGTTRVSWAEGSTMGAPGHRILNALNAMRQACEP